MANVSVSYQEMQDQASKLNSARSDIDAQLGALRTQIAGLVSGGFVTDSASGAFQQSFDEFKKSSDQVMEGLDGMATYLNKAVETLSQVDTELANALK